MTTTSDKTKADRCECGAFATGARHEKSREHAVSLFARRAVARGLVRTWHADALRLLGVAIETGPNDATDSGAAFAPAWADRVLGAECEMHDVRADGACRVCGHANVGALIFRAVRDDALRAVIERAVADSYAAADLTIVRLLQEQAAARPVVTLAPAPAPLTDAELYRFTG